MLFSNCFTLSCAPKSSSLSIKSPALTCAPSLKNTSVIVPCASDTTLLLLEDSIAPDPVTDKAKSPLVTTAVCWAKVLCVFLLLLLLKYHQVPPEIKSTTINE